MLQSNIQDFKEYSQFSSLKDFNNNIEMWMTDIKNKFTKGQLIAIKRLIRYCAKIPGISNAKIGTILKAINDQYNDNGISRSTFKRAISLAKELGLLTVHELVRKNGSKSSNLYVFNRYVSNAEQSDSTILWSENSSISQSNEPSIDDNLNRAKTINLSKSSKQLNNIRKDKPVSFVNPWVNGEFARFAEYYFHCPKQINEMWKISFLNAKKFDIASGDLATLSIRCLQALLTKMKGKRIKNPLGYYTGVIRKQMQAQFMRNAFLEVFDA
ncbi:hypothetical protein [Bacillus sp. JJ1474]|uniref:hypothetical protein n=1 Tax=Bacillus sp. JJ1474 TaxID=3122955 RepID=UPI002FFE452B